MARLSARVEREREPQVVEEVHQHRLAGADEPLPFKPAEYTSQRDRVVERSVSSPWVDAEADRDVLELGAAPRQGDRKRQRVVEHEAVHAVHAGREPT